MAALLCTCGDDGVSTSDAVADAPDAEFVEAGCLQVDRLKPQVVPPAGVRLTFRVLDCDGFPVRKLAAGDVAAINDEAGAPFGGAAEAGEASSPIPPPELLALSLLVLDMSDSTVAGGIFDQIIDGAKGFAQGILSEEHQHLRPKVAVIVFGAEGSSAVAVQPTSDLPVLEAALEGLRAGSGLGERDLHGAVTLGLDELQS